MAFKNIGNAKTKLAKNHTDSNSNIEVDIIKILDLLIENAFCELG